MLIVGWHWSKDSGTCSWCNQWIKQFFGRRKKWKVMNHYKRDGRTTGTNSGRFGGVTTKPTLAKNTARARENRACMQQMGGYFEISVNLVGKIQQIGQICGNLPATPPHYPPNCFHNSYPLSPLPHITPYDLQDKCCRVTTLKPEPRRHHFCFIWI